MFPKVVALLVLFATSVIAGPIRVEPGVYRITNVQSGGAACVYSPSGPIYVCEEPRAPFDIWNITAAEDDGYTIANVGINATRMPDIFAAVFVAMDGQPVVTKRRPTVFNIESAGNDKYIIKLQYVDLLWNAESSAVKLRPAKKLESQKWRFTPAHWPPQNFNLDRWNFPQRI